MSRFAVTKIGQTGPAGRIGSGSAYHIDTKFSSNLGWDNVRDRFDALGRRYAQDGRKIEFSNQGVAGSVYDLNASPEERMKLLQRAAGAHASRPGWHSFDYYAPTIKDDRWQKSAEGAPIYLVSDQGATLEGGQGGGYGNYGVSLLNGQVMSKSGHGDTNFAVFKPGTTPLPNGNGTPEPSTAAPIDATPTETGLRQEALERTTNYANMSKAELNAAYDAMRGNPALADVEGMKMHKAFFGK